MRYLFTLSLLFAAGPALADAYKCRLPDGRIEIASQPCSSGATLAVRPDETIPETKRLQAERDVQRMRERLEKREAEQRMATAGEREKDRQLARERATALPPPTAVAPSNFASADECLRSLDQMTLEATQRDQMEANCRLIAPQAPLYVPVPGADSGKPPTVVIGK